MTEADKRRSVVGVISGGRDRACVAASSLVVLVVVVLVVALTGCRSDDRSATGSKSGERIGVSSGALSGFNLVLVSIDTIRADRIGCYGHKQAETPTIDGLAARGVRCDRAITPAPLTLPAHCSLLTGLNPQHHGARVNAVFSLEDRIRTLAEILGEQGYRTAAVVSAFVLDRQFGLSQGFEHYADDLTKDGRRQAFGYRERSAENSNRHAVEWLDKHASERFFLFVHYFDPHFPYSPPKPYDDRHKDRPYDGEIAYADAQLGQLLSAVDRKGVRDKTLVVVVSDHGESLGEHEELTHGLLLYDATVRVPMIFNAPPPFPQGITLTRQVGLIDVVPTVLDLLGLPAVKDLDGVSLLRPFSGKNRAIYIETLWTKITHNWSPLVGIRRNDAKFILAPKPELYDLEADPNELKDLFGQQPQLAADMHQQLRDLSGGDPKMLSLVAGNLPIDEESRKKLIGLGYVVASSAPTTKTAELPNPMDMMATWSESQEARKLANAGQFAEAVAALEPFVYHHPKDVSAVGLLADCYLKLGRSDDAVRMFRRYAELAVRKAEPFSGLGLALIKQGKLDEAEKVLRIVIGEDATNRASLFGLGMIAARRGRSDRAMELFQECVVAGRGTHTAPAHHNIGVLHERAGRKAEARKSFEQALELDPHHVKAARSLAMVLAKEGQRNQAVKILARAIGKRACPDARVQLGRLLIAEGKVALAEGQFRQAIGYRADHVDAHHHLGLALVRQDKHEQAAKHLRQCLKLDSKRVDSRLHLGVLLGQRGKLDEARAHLEQVVKQMPDWSPGHYNLGAVLARQKRLKEAEREFTVVIRLNPGNARAHNALGQVLMEMGERDAADKEFRQALKIAPGLDSAHESLRRLSTQPAR